MLLRPRRSIRAAFFGLLIAIGGLSLSVHAQEFRATVQGTVTDQTGAVIPSADVTLTNVQTGVERQTTTNSGGLYVFQFLPPGLYRLSVSGQGFKTNVRDGIDLSLGQNQRVNVELELGAVTETVEVVGDVSLVETDSSSLGAVVRSEIKDNLPLKGHSSLFMFTLTPGVVNNRYGEDTRSNDTITNVLFSANGSPVASGDVSVDGAINTVNVNREVNISQWVPAVDAVGEFKLQTGVLPAEYGRTGGSFMNIVIKSGTNELHGSVYDFFQNSKLNGNLFFARGQGQDLTAFGANTYGATVGGPIKRNRTFFFFSFEGSREGNGLNRTNSVPTPLMRQGDFSEVSNPLYDPFSVADVDGVPTRQRFANNVIPQSRLDPVGSNVVTFFPEANTQPSNPAQPWVRNFTFSDKWPRAYTTTVTKVDHQVNENWNLFVRMNRGLAFLGFPHDFDGIAASGRNQTNRPHFGVSVGNTILLNPRTTFDVRLGYTWGLEKRRPWSEGFDVTTLGFSQAFRDITQTEQFPRFGFSGFQSMANSIFRQFPGYTWTLQPSVSMMRGKHLLKFGFEGRLIYGNFFNNNIGSGNFSFGNAWTDGPRADTPSPNTGFPIASLLVGLGSGSIDFNQGVSVLDKYFAGYVQDDYKVTPKLTLNLGFRYGFETGRTERYDRATRGFCFSCPSPLQAPGMNLQGGLLFAGRDGVPREIYDRDKNNFAPRIGLAYSLTPNTVVRAGYGLYYIPVIGTVESPGFDARTPWVTSLDGGITPANTLSSPFPDGHLPITGASEGLLTLAGQSIRFVEPTDRTGMFHTWNLNIQKSLPGQAVLEVGYVGSRGIKIAFDRGDTGFGENINQLPPQFLSMGDALTERVPNPFFGIIETGALSGPTVQRQQLLRPFPHFQNINRIKPAFGNSVYHGFQLRYQKRMVNGLTALVSYTASKLISDINASQNNFDRQAERAVGEFDVPQRLTITAAYELPFGRDRRYGKGMSKAADVVVGGWTISTFNTFQSGFPLTFTTNRSNIFAVGTGAQRPNVVGDPSVGADGSHSQRLDGFFNTDAFAQPADFAFGNLGARLATVRRPGMNNVNLSLTKNFKVGERVGIQFRASSFNLLNHPVFGAPNTRFGNASFGKIFGQANLSRQTEFMLRINY